MIKINKSEYLEMQHYIEESCGILLTQGKEYLIESRLTDLLMEEGCASFHTFLEKARTDYTGALRNRIVDAMTTNETFWFRDKSTWDYISGVMVPMLVEKAEQGRKSRVWSAAASTGQEAYSLMILLDEAVRARNTPNLLNRIEVVGTDISPSALGIAREGKYDEMAMGRGMPMDKKERYFEKKGIHWEIDDALKTRVEFKQFNLKQSFMAMGMFDFILCRYVAIYFSDDLKKALFTKMYNALHPGGVLMLGATESIRGFSEDFNIAYHKDAVINQKPID